MIGAKLKEIRESTGMNKKEFAEHIGLKYTTYNNYETEAREPASDFLILISEKFDVSIDYLLGLKDEKEILHSYQLRADEYNHIKKYRTLDPFGQETVSYILDRESNRVKSLQEQTGRIAELESTLDTTPGITRMYTYMHKIACAGTGFYFDDIPTDTIEAPYMEGADFIIGVNGDSMEPDYHDGDMLYVKKMESLNIGDVGIFTIDNECFLKEYGENGLISRNYKYKDIPGSEDIRLIGKIIGKVMI